LTGYGYEQAIKGANNCISHSFKVICF